MHSPTGSSQSTRAPRRPKWPIQLPASDPFIAPGRDTPADHATSLEGENGEVTLWPAPDLIMPDIGSEWAAIPAYRMPRFAPDFASEGAAGSAGRQRPESLDFRVAAIPGPHLTC